MGWFKDVVQELTGESSSKIAQAGHDMRDDSGARTDEDLKHFVKAPEWADKTPIAGVEVFPKNT